MNGHSRNCAFCGSAIGPGERWVRERGVMERQESSYRYYHIATSDSNDSSCWEKHQLEGFGCESRICEGDPEQGFAMATG